MSFNVEVESNLSDQEDALKKFLDSKEKSADRTVQNMDEKIDKFKELDKPNKDLWDQYQNIISIYEEEIRWINGEFVKSDEVVDESELKDKAALGNGLLFPDGEQRVKPKRVVGLDGGSGNKDDDEIYYKTGTSGNTPGETEEELFEQFNNSTITQTTFLTEWEAVLRTQYDPPNGTGVLIDQQNAVRNNKDIGGQGSTADDHIEDEKANIDDMLSNLTTTRISERQGQIDERVNNTDSELDVRVSNLNDKLTSDPAYYDKRYQIVVARVHVLLGTLSKLESAKQLKGFWQDTKQDVSDINSLYDTV